MNKSFRFGRNRLYSRHVRYMFHTVRMGESLCVCVCVPARGISLAVVVVVVVRWSHTIVHPEASRLLATFIAIVYYFMAHRTEHKHIDTRAPQSRNFYRSGQLFAQIYQTMLPLPCHHHCLSSSVSVFHVLTSTLLMYSTYKYITSVDVDEIRFLSTLFVLFVLPNEYYDVMMERYRN